jgi:hypothetical protein
MKEPKPHKLNNVLLSIIAILAIFFIVWVTTYSTTRGHVVQSNDNLIGQATQAVSDNSNDLHLSFCKLIVRETAIYDGTVLTTSLSVGESVYYSGHTISIKEITNDVCVVGVDESFDYIALGQIQKLNSVYITVKDIVK